MKENVYEITELQICNLRYIQGRLDGIAEGLKLMKKDQAQQLVLDTAIKLDKILNEIRDGT